MSAATVARCHSIAVCACASCASDDRTPADSRSRCAASWSRSSRATIWPFFTASPSSRSARSAGPAVLNAMLTSVSSIFPETTIRSEGVRPFERYA